MRATVRTEVSHSPGGPRPKLRVGAPVVPRRSDAARSYAAYAGVFLALTVVGGVWLRVALAGAPVLGGLSFAHLVHAHSHVAFFGWTSMALFAVLVRSAQLPRSALWPRVHAHLVGVASAAAFVGFLLGGYNRYTIALSAIHVLLWILFAAAIWRPLARVAGPARAYLRGSLLFLLLAGLGAIAPTVTRVRGIEDPWLTGLAVELFLTPFIAGWLLLGVGGAVYARLWRPRFDRAVLWLVVLGAYPSLLLRVTAPPPAEWLEVVGRLGTGGLGAASLLFALDVLASRGMPPMLRLAGAAALSKGVAELLVASGMTLGIATNRPVVIAYLHLVLLGLVTPALLACALQVRGATRAAGAHALGMAAMLGALLAWGWPTFAVRMAEAGGGTMALQYAALAGAVLSAAAILVVLAECAGIRLSLRGRAAADISSTPTAPTRPLRASVLPRL